MAAPHEVVAAPLTVWLAPVGTAFPDTDETPAGAWEKLGTSGDLNYDEDGLTVTHSQTIETFTPVGAAVPRKAFRTQEGWMIEFNLVDISPDEYAKVMNDATVGTDAFGAGTPGTKTVPLELGLDVALFALLARGQSPVSNDMPGQFEVLACYQAGEPAPVFKKGEPAALACQFVALKQSASAFANFVVQTHDAS